EYASFSFHLLTKLSWQALHFRFTPRKTCAVLCDACIHGVTAADVSPRQFTPTRKPSGSPAPAGFSSARTNRSNGMLDCSAGSSQWVMLLRRAVSEKYETPSSLRSRSFQNEIQCSAYGPLDASNRSASAERFAGARSATNARRSSGGGGRPHRSRYTRRA